ncbi:hypothetical protein [Pseudosporangium ferrugineum]|uniref:Uncharacterized protein n=1 Tax=Pseudosporangium ferrugineum TaxID=439699 RepID=A0A2T0SIE2_9ACTN|nr:hypothetical protein [Pseudosporangium ferrugineum]PRY33180.1 hypothetical protein CLV70_101342 [Pseudosporangium ferrugineum]
MRIDGTAGVEPGFSHGDGTVRDPGARMSSTTRYLSGAAYVDEKFADDVIRELVADSHRAVAPAVGYDVTTVIRHCFRAQRLWLAQNAVITAILLVGLAFFTSATVTVLAVCVAAAVFTSEHPEPGRRPSWKAVATGLAALLLIGCVLGPLLGLVQALGDPFAGGGSFDGSFGEGGTGGTGTDLTGTVLVFLLKVALVAGAAYATVVWSRQRMIGIITADLGRGGPRAAPPANRREVEQRLRVIDEAQHGNILLHSGYEPFVGAGRRANAWSIATELRPEQDDEHPGDRVDGGSRPRPLTGRVPIDPVELVTHLRRRLAALRSRDLPPQERIGGLQLRDLVVSSGARWHDYPLIDERAKLPYTFAPAEAINAIIRFPQTGARHFLRATVGAAEMAAVTDDGRAVMPAEHQSVVGSTYVHVAVEGGLLYVELVTAVLGPIEQRYLDIDVYDRGTDALTTAAGEALRRVFRTTALAPLRLIRSAVRAVTLVNAIHRADREAAEDAVYDFGARVDVRQLGSRDGFANYLQRLDAEKYTRLIDRRATEAIYEFLTDKGVDTSDFAAKVNFRQYNNTTIGGSAYGPVATGTGASATMSAAAAALTGGRKKGNGS